MMMKGTWVLFCFSLILLTSCNSKEYDLEGIWIEKSYYPPSTWDSIGAVHKTLYHFEQEQLIIEDFYTGARSVEKGKFNFFQNQIIATFENRIDTIDVKFLSEKETVFSTDDYSILLEKIQLVDPPIKKERLKTTLLSTAYNLSWDTLDFDFRENNLVITNSISRDFSMVPQYYIDTFYDHLFLRFPNSTGPMLQILSIESDTIKTRYFGIENYEVNLIPLKPKQHYTELDFIGTWEEIPGKDSYSRRLLELYEEMGEEGYYKKEILVISKNKITQYVLFNEKERTWSLSKLKNQIIFNEPWWLEAKNQWTIRQINEDILIIERRLKDIREQNPIEVITYRKIK